MRLSPDSCRTIQDGGKFIEPLDTDLRWPNRHDSRSSSRRTSSSVTHGRGPAFRPCRCTSDLCRVGRGRSALSARTADAKDMRSLRSANCMRNVVSWPRFARKTMTAPENGSSARTSTAKAARLWAPLRKSTGCMARATRAPAGIWIIAARPRHGSRATPWSASAVHAGRHAHHRTCELDRKRCSVALRVFAT